MVVYDFIETKESKSGSYSGSKITPLSTEVISSNTINVKGKSYIKIATGTLNNLSNPTTGQNITIQATGTITVNDIDSSTNIVLAGTTPTSFTMGDGNTLQLIYDGTNWQETSRSVNTTP